MQGIHPAGCEKYGAKTGQGHVVPPNSRTNPVCPGRVRGILSMHRPDHAPGRTAKNLRMTDTLRWEMPITVQPVPRWFFWHPFAQENPRSVVSPCCTLGISPIIHFLIVSNSVSHFEFSGYLDEIPRGIRCRRRDGRVTGACPGNDGPLPGLPGNGVRILPVLKRKGERDGPMVLPVSL